MSGKQPGLRVANLDCEHHAHAIEHEMQGFPGLLDLKVYPIAAKVVLTYDPERTSPNALREKLKTLGFPVQEGRALAEQPRAIRELHSVGVNKVVMLTGDN